jgi:hypothetical protein
MKLKKIPDQIFVTSKIVEDRIFHKVNGEYDYKNPTIEKHIFGFLHPHEPKVKTDAFRKATQMRWAYEGEVYLIGNEYRQRGRTYSFVSLQMNRQYVPFDKPIDLAVIPRIWDNVPLAGFKIIDTVNRYRGNKLMKVLDPRGIEFEITIKSLFNIIQEGKIEHGEIMSKCVWKSGKDLVVVQ